MARNKKKRWERGRKDGGAGGGQLGEVAGRHLKKGRKESECGDGRRAEMQRLLALGGKMVNNETLMET